MEIYAIILVVIKWNSFIFVLWLLIYVDVYSLPAIKALNSGVVKTKSLDDCIQPLTLTSYQMKLIWAPGHQNTRVNGKADYCYSQLNWPNTCGRYNQMVCN